MFVSPGVHQNVECTFIRKPHYLWLNLTDKTAEVKWDHFLASEVPTVRPGRDKLCSTDLDAPARV